MYNFLQQTFTRILVKINSIIDEFYNMFNPKNDNKTNEDILINFLESYEIQRKFNLTKKAAFSNSIKTPTKKISWKQMKKLNEKDEKNKIELKKKRSKKYMLLIKYKSDIIQLKQENLSLNKIAKVLMQKHNITKKLQPSRQNIFNFIKEHKL